MSDIKASERRLAAALDRIDYLLETASVGAVRSPASSSDDGAALTALQNRLDQALADNQGLQAALDAMRPEAMVPAAAAAGAGNGSAALAEQAARLSAANEELIAANRGLIVAVGGQNDQVEAVAVALEAEIEALRAARAAEISQIADIMAELQRLLADSADSAADGAGMDGAPELTRKRDPGFDGVYGDEDDDDLDDSANGGR